MDMFRLVIYDTLKEKYIQAEYKYEYLGDRESIWNLWFILHETKKHIQIFNLAGELQNPHEGPRGFYSHAI